MQILSYNRHKYKLSRFKGSKTKKEEYCCRKLLHFIQNVSIYEAIGEICTLVYDYVDCKLDRIIVCDNVVETYTHAVPNICKIIKLYAKRCNIHNINSRVIQQIVMRFIKNFSACVSLDVLVYYGFRPDNEMFYLAMFQSTGVKLSVPNFRIMCEYTTINDTSSRKITLKDIAEYMLKESLPNPELYMEIALDSKNISFTANELYYVIRDVIINLDYFGFNTLSLLIRKCDFSVPVSSINGSKEYTLNRLLKRFAHECAIRYELVKLFIQYHKTDLIDNLNDSVINCIIPHIDGIEMYMLLIENGINVNYMHTYYFQSYIVHYESRYNPKTMYHTIKYLIGAGLDVSRFELVRTLYFPGWYEGKNDNGYHYIIKSMKLLLKNEISIKKKDFYASRLNTAYEILLSLGFIWHNRDGVTRMKPLPSLYVLCLRKVYTTKSIDTKGFPKLLLEFPEENGDNYVISKW